MICERCEKRETRYENGKICEACNTREWRQKNPENVKDYYKFRRKRDVKKIRKSQYSHRDRINFGGNRELALKRDNYTCQKCGKSRNDGKKIIVHHKDGNGWAKKNLNNDMKNLITLCVQCHMDIHRPSDNIKKIGKYPELLKQDDSEYKYPRVRKILIEKKIKLGTITRAKEELAEEIGMSYSTVDHLYYKRKCLSILNSKNNTPQANSNQKGCKSTIHSDGSPEENNSHNLNKESQDGKC